MSRKSIVHDWRDAIRAADLSMAEAAVMFALSCYMDASGRCWPSVPTIAEHSKAGQSTVFRALKSLTAKGWLTVESGGSRGGSNQYEARFPEGWESVNPSRSERGPLPLRESTPPALGGELLSEQPSELSPAEDGLSALIEEWWSDVSSPKERKSVAQRIRRVCKGWSPAAVEKVVTFKPKGTYSIGWLRFVLAQVEGRSEADGLARLQVLQAQPTRGGRVGGVAGKHEDFGDTRRLGKDDDWGGPEGIEGAGA